MIINFSICLKVSLYLILLSIHVTGVYSSFENHGVMCRKTEMVALLKFKAELIDDFGQLSTWGHDEKDCCKWEGVLCDNRTNQVVALDLHGQGLGGKVSSSLLELANLNYLDLSFNDFTESQIPEFVGSLSKLQHLNLNFSNFDGLIPHSLGNLSNLRFLDLSGNWILDTNLDWLSRLQSLEYLDLSTANLHKATTWPQAINKMAALKEIHLQSCELSTNMLDSLPLANASSSLVVLDLPGNALRDTSTSLRFLNTSSRWRYVDLSYNILQGAIPTTFGNLMSLSHLDLSMNHLEGRIPDALGSVTSLSYLDLSKNHLSGEFPYALGNLTRLSHLDLADNQLQGEFPRMSNQLKELRIEGDLRLRDLEVLDLSMNKFSGRVPDLSACSSLRWLSIYDNMFNGTVTESIGYLSNIRHLDLGSNHLEGLISEAHLLNLSKLQVLDLSFNTNLTVTIGSFWDPPFQLSRLMLAHCELGPYFPKWLQNQKQVEFVDISSAKISDTVPHWFWDNIHMCEHLNMSYNQIYGVLPDLSSKLNLLTIDLSFNEFNGSLPLLPRYINNIYLSGNKFSGTIINFCNFKKLCALDLSNNLFSVEISPYCFMKLLRLLYLNLANNNFFGEIPNSIGFCGLYSLHLENNSFTGYLSRSLKNCSNLIILDLGGNKFTGKIPSWLGESMPELGVLSLKSNKLYGVLPSSLCHLAKLQVWDISGNMISGAIPKCVKNFTVLSSKPNDNSGDNRFVVRDNMTQTHYDSAQIMWKGKMAEYVNALKLLRVVDLSSNSLIGEIPVEVTSLVGLFGLNLSRNNLVGSIPRDIGGLEVLNFLDLSKNNLSGNIPPTLSQLSHLGMLDLSFNNLSGRIPWDSHMQTFSASTYMGNPGLCGPPLVLKPCTEDEMPKKPKSIDNGDEVHENEFITKGFYVSITLGFIIAFWGVSGTLFLNKRCRITIVRMVITVEDWLYVNILVNKNRMQRYFKDP